MTETQGAILEVLRKAAPSFLTAGQIRAQLPEELFEKTSREEIVAALEQMARVGLVEMVTESSVRGGEWRVR